MPVAMLLAFASQDATTAQLPARAAEIAFAADSESLQRWRAGASRADPEAMFNLGLAYRLGRGVGADPQRAIFWYREAARHGHRPATLALAACYIETGEPGLAVPLLLDGVERGDPLAEYLMGVLLFSGRGIARDRARAYALLARSSAAGFEPATRTIARLDSSPGASGEAAARLAVAGRAPGALGRPRPADGVSSAARSGGPELVGTIAPGPSPRITPGRAGDRTVMVASATRALRSVALPERRARSQVPAERRAPAEAWHIQLGAFADPGNAQRLWRSVEGRFAGAAVRLVRSGKLTRLVAGPFRSQRLASAACAGRNPCMVFR